MLRRNFRNQKNLLYVVCGARSLLWNLSALFYILSPSWKSLPSAISSVVAFISIVTKNHAYFSFNFFSYQRLLIFQIKSYVFLTKKHVTSSTHEETNFPSWVYFVFILYFIGTIIFKKMFSKVGGSRKRQRGWSYRPYRQGYLIDSGGGSHLLHTIQ